jgi:hypothetical protein
MLKVHRIFLFRPPRAPPTTKKRGLSTLRLPLSPSMIEKVSRHKGHDLKPSMIEKVSRHKGHDLKRQVEMQRKQNSCSQAANSASS